jgi:hypothetical protein
MEKSIEYRKESGENIYSEYLNEIDLALKNLLSAIEGFRRDADLAKKSNSPIKVEIDTKRIFIPPTKNDKGFFTGAAETLVRMTKAFDGKIDLTNGWEKDEDVRHKAWTELRLIHENLVFVGAAGRILYGTLNGASRAFHEFNGNNDEAHIKANIFFEEDDMNVCIATTHAIIEHSIRLDINTMTDIEKVRKDDSLAIV